MSKTLIKQMTEEGYIDVKSIEGRGLCGIYPFVFTWGLIYGLDPTGYRGRYCYHSRSEAVEAYKEWNGIGDPSGNWVKHKGSVEYSNPNYIKSGQEDEPEDLIKELLKNYA